MTYDEISSGTITAKFTQKGTVYSVMGRSYVSQTSNSKIMVYVNQKFYGEANCNGGLTVTLQKGDIMKLSHLYGQEFKGWYVDDKRITSRAEVEIRETEYPSGTVFYAIFGDSPY